MNASPDASAVDGPGANPGAGLGSDIGGNTGGNLADLVRAAARQRPDVPALITDGCEGAGRGQRILTWRDLDDQADGLARGLLDLGMHGGDRVALLLGNVAEFATCYFGVLRAGGVVVPVDAASGPAEVAHVLADSGARIVLTEPTDAALVAAVRDRCPALERVVTLGAAGPIAAAGPLRGIPEDPAPGGTTLAALLYTSGASGPPKGAMLTHRALLADLDHACRVAPPVVAPGDVVLLAVPLPHSYGLNAGLGLLARHAATGVLVDYTDPARALRAMAAHRVTVVVGVPRGYEAWSDRPELRAAFATVRVAVSAGSALPAAVLHRIRDRTGVTVCEGYGQAETGSMVTTSLLSDPVQPGSIGRPVPGVTVRLVDDTGEEVDEEDTGEIEVCGANLFSGYWPDRRGGLDERGGWRTGDVAYADPSGNVFLVDRATDALLVSGFRVYPREVERALLSHPDVTEAAVVGLPSPDTGEAVKAVVVARPGSTLDTAQVMAHAARLLARFKRPTGIDVVAELPHTSTGAVRRAGLRAQRGEGSEPLAATARMTHSGAGARVHPG